MTAQRESSKLLKPALLLIGGAVLIYFLFARPIGFNDFKGRQPPSLASQGTWLNSTTPISWDSLLGDVVWLEFSFLH